MSASRPVAVAFAYHNMGCTGLEALLRAGFDVRAVFAHEDDPSENVWFRSVSQIARERGIPSFNPDGVKGQEWLDKVKGLAPDFIFSFYYRRLLPKAILEIPPKGAFNLHGSLLPKYRGRCPVNWVLVNGETETGVTLHYMTKSADDGDVVAQRKVPIDIKDTALTLFGKMEKAAAALLAETLPLLRDGKAPRVPQDHSKATCFGGRKAEDGKIDWKKPAREIYNLVRAVADPYPGAFCLLGGRRLFVWEGGFEEKGGGGAGAVEVDGKGGIAVGTGAGRLVLVKIQPEGGEKLDAAAAVRSGLLKDGGMLE